MLRKAALALGFAILLGGCAASGGSHSVARIDASSEAAAEASYKAMMRQLSEPKKRQLGLAVVMLNMVGVNSVYEVINNPELKAPSVGRIKDRVAGMSADEIIALAAKTSTVRIEAVETTRQ
ncbi:hypothetical protein J2X06_001092 [Lysobacter niastensis]|uniref:Uncharacterized protein n=1 Tax=Lysobacter niastensis TaxID=380629 RepID=A0ABU1W8I6_9GAMM|nr:DUF6694 family lipoprotein [Lysobacter niastensis]MDR7133908.1 hypothetical protein [Lysobacter niastensis]